MIKHVERVRVRWVDTDASGRIHYTAAFRYFEIAEPWKISNRIVQCANFRGSLTETRSSRR